MRVDFQFSAMRDCARLTWSAHVGVWRVRRVHCHIGGNVRALTAAVIQT